MKYLVAGALLAGTAISSAHAADLAARPYTKAPAYVAPIYDWTGFYFGVNAGVGLGRDRIVNGIGGVSNNSTYLQPEGFVGGGQIGYNWQTNSSFLGLGPMVFGVEADIQGGDMRDGRTTLNTGLLATRYNERLDYFGTVRGRVGLTTGPVLSYVTGGYAFGNVKTDITQTLGGVSLPTSISNDTRSGYVLGSGVEAALGGNWTGKIEYLYLNLGNRGATYTAFVPQAANSEYRENIFRVGLNYRIGGNSVYAPLVASNWTGFYLGGNVGSGVGRDRSSLNVGGVAGVTDVFNLAPDGYNGGVQAGYNWQAGAFVFGLEADFQASAQRDNKTCVLTCSTAVGASYDSKLPYFGTARGRIGYSVGPTLFYATGGYAYGNVKTDITTNLGSPVAVTTGLRSDRSGYAVGGGIETPFTFLGLFGPNWTTKAEYLYVDLGRSTDAFTVPVAGGGTTTLTNTTRVQEHIFRTGINYHFNSPVVAKY